MTDASSLKKNQPPLRAPYLIKWFTGAVTVITVACALYKLFRPNIEGIRDFLFLCMFSVLMYLEYQCLEQDTRWLVLRPKIAIPLVVFATGTDLFLRWNRSLFLIDFLCGVGLLVCFLLLGWISKRSAARVLPEVFPPGGARFGFDQGTGIAVFLLGMFSGPEWTDAVIVVSTIAVVYHFYCVVVRRVFNRDPNDLKPIPAGRQLVNPIVVFIPLLVISAVVIRMPQYEACRDWLWNVGVNDQAAVVYELHERLQHAPRIISPAPDCPGVELTYDPALTARVPREKPSLVYMPWRSVGLEDKYVFRDKKTSLIYTVRPVYYVVDWKEPTK